MDLSNPEELLRKLSRTYRLRLDTLSLAGEVWPLYVAENLDELLELLLAKGPGHQAVQDEQIPYYAELWPSAMVMARYLRQQSELIAGKRVLEIGCGLGLAGAAAGRGGAEVLLTDYLEDALHLAALNWWSIVGTEPQVALLDWREPEVDFLPEVILAADVAYEARNYEPLFACFDELLPANGLILLTEPGRSFARPFLEELPRRGFAVERSVQAQPFRGMTYQVGLYQVRRLAR